VSEVRTITSTAAATSVITCTRVGYGLNLCKNEVEGQAACGKYEPESQVVYKKYLVEYEPLKIFMYFWPKLPQISSY
jgi:hypothetical protein